MAEFLRELVAKWGLDYSDEGVSGVTGVSIHVLTSRS
jgi:hypothetical protein